MARAKAERTEDQWEKIAPLFPEPQASPWGGPNPSPTVPVSKGFCGFYARERAGKTSPNNLLPPVRAGDACALGTTKTCG